MAFDRHWQSKVNFYICNVIGHEGPKSLLSELIGQGLATTLMATDVTRCRGQFGELTVSISLTNKGVDNYKEVLVLLFSYLDQIKKEGVQEYFFDELKIMGHTIYNTVGGGTAVRTAMSKAQLMAQMCDNDMPKWLISKDFIYVFFNRGLIEKTLIEMTP